MRLPLRKEIHKRIKKGYCQSKWEINENELKRNWYFYGAGSGGGNVICRSLYPFDIFVSHVCSGNEIFFFPIPFRIICLCFDTYSIRCSLLECGNFMDRRKFLFLFENYA